MGKVKQKTLKELKPIDFDRLPLLLTDVQAAEVIGVSAGYLRLARCEGERDGRIPAPRFVRLMGRVWYPKDDIFAWVNGLERMTAI
ncbi:hypothetical protein FACS1894187_05170 [Synergistales bacterium]|nr:hypothetical protein FACS1894187_05170 [Synergistales bacterium]